MIIFYSLNNELEEFKSFENKFSISFGLADWKWSSRVRDQVVSQRDFRSPNHNHQQVRKTSTNKIFWILSESTRTNRSEFSVNANIETLNSESEDAILARVLAQSELEHRQKQQQQQQQRNGNSSEDKCSLQWTNRWRNHSNSPFTFSFCISVLSLVYDK